MPKSKHRKNHQKALARSSTRPPPGGAGLPVARPPVGRTTTWTTFNKGWPARVAKDFSDIADRDYKGTKVEVVQAIFNDIRAAGMVPGVVSEWYDSGIDEDDGLPYDHSEIGMTCPHGVMGDSISVNSHDLVTWEADERGWSLDGCVQCGIFD